MASYSGVVAARLEPVADRAHGVERAGVDEHVVGVVVVELHDRHGRFAGPVPRCSAKKRSNPTTTSSAIDSIEPDRSSRNQIAAPATGSTGRPARRRARMRSASTR